MWEDGDQVLVSAVAKERGASVLSNGVVRRRT